MASKGGWGQGGGQHWQQHGQQQANWTPSNARPSQADSGKGGSPTQQQQQRSQQQQQQQQQGKGGQQQGQQQQRIVPGGKGGAAPGSGASETYVVTTKGNDTNEVVIRTLVGEYVDHSSNHSRKVYKKVNDNPREPVDVFLYYWDKRDGASLEGWWFGNQLGGSQVWSHCMSSAMTPPSSGWRIPWDGGVRPTLSVMPKQSPRQREFEEKFKELGTAATEAQHAIKAALEGAKAAAGDSSPEGLKTAEEALEPQVSTINELMKRLMELQKGIPAEPLQRCNALGTSLRGAQQAVNAELAKIRSAKSKMEQSEKQKATEEKEAIQLSELMIDATQKTNAAEDSVEKAVITSEMISAGGDDMDEMKQAVTQTEQAAQEAQKSIGEARIYLNAKQASARRFESAKVKEQAAADLGKLQQQLQEAQNKLNPLKSVRQEFMQRTAVQHLLQEVLEKLSPAEVDVDRAEEATVMLNGDGLTKEMMDVAEQSISKAGDHIASVLKFLEQKKKSATGLAMKEIGKMEERAKSSQARLQEFKNAHKEAAERVTCETLLKEAAEKLLSVAESVARAADCEGPFLMGVEELPLDETLAAVKACEAASTTANTAVSIARMFIATKIVEAKRFSAGPSKDAQAKLKDYQSELETHTKKLMDLKKNTATRKKVATMREAEAEVQKAEELAKKVGEVAAGFEDDSNLLTLSSKEIRAASDETVKAEQVANAALIEARKFITARQIESKGKEMSQEVSAELIKYQTRLSTAQAEIGKYKKISGSVEQRLAAKKVLEDAQGKLKAATEKVSKVVVMVEALGTEAPAEDPEGTAKSGGEAEQPAETGPKAAEHVAAEAQVAVKTISRFLETQTRVQGVAKDELGKLQVQVKGLQEKLDATVTIMRERTEKLLMDTIIKDSEGRVQEAEEAMKKVVDAEAVFAKSTDDLPIDEASSALNELDSALQMAHTVVGGAKTFLAMKRLGAKRLSEKSAKVSADLLGELQTRLDTVTKTLGDAKKGMAERRLATVKREVAEKVVDVEAKVAAAMEATKALCDGATDVGPEEMKSACEKAGTSQHEAQSTLANTRTLLLTRQRDAKVIATDSSILLEINKMLEKLTKIQADLDKQKNQLREQEHKFVAQRLLKDAADLVDELDKKLEATVEVASPLSSDKEDFAAGVYLFQAIDALRAHAKENSKTPKEVFDAMSENGSISKNKFVAFCQTLPKLKEELGSVPTEEQLQAAFGRLDTKGAGEVTEPDFIDQLRVRFIIATTVSMTESLTVKGGTTVRKVDVQEVVEALGEPSKDESVGLMRLKCRAEKDDKEGYITVAGNQGTVYLEPYSPHAALQKRIERALQECADTAKEAQKYLEQKSDELKPVRTGPLAETKAELGKMRPRVSKVQYTLSQLKKRVADSDKRMKEKIESERRKSQEAAERKAAAAITEEVEGLLTTNTAAVEAVMPSVEALVTSRGKDEENPLKAMEKAKAELDALVEGIEKATAKIKEKMEAIKTSAKGPFSEARQTLVKIKVKVGALDSKCKKKLVDIRGARKQVVTDAQLAITESLRAHVQKEGIKADGLFKQLSDGGADVSAGKLREFFEQIPKVSLKAVQLDIGLDAYASGVTRLAFSEMLQEYQKCVKEIALTTSSQVKESKTIRKLMVGEIVEVVDAAKVDEATGLQRAKCRALKDDKEGWVTIRGNQGTDFLEKTMKPYYCCEEETPMQAAFEVGSAEACKAQVGEVLEILGGPQKETSLETQRVRGKAVKDGKAGWATLKDPAGNPILEPTKLLVVKQGIVVTSSFDIVSGKAIRRLAAGETLEQLEGPKEDEVRSLMRVKVTAKLDSIEGWVTMKGNQGTAYVEESSRYHIVKTSTSLESKFATGSSALRTLEEGEVFEVLEGPKTETKEGPNRVKCLNLSNSTEGWFTLTAKNVQPWSPQYKCAQGTTMTDGLNIKEAKTVRKVEAGERLVALEAPALEKGAGIMRVKVRAEKDGAVGYATIRGNQGTVLLKPVFA